MLRTVMDSTDRIGAQNCGTAANFDCRSSTVNVPTFEEEACVFESPHSLLTDSAFHATLVITLNPKATGGEAGRPFFFARGGTRGGGSGFGRARGRGGGGESHTTTPAARLQACAMHMPHAHHTRAAATRACRPWPTPPGPWPGPGPGWRRRRRRELRVFYFRCYIYGQKGMRGFEHAGLLFEGGNVNR